MPRRTRRQPASSAQLELGFASSPRQVERIFLGWSEPLLALAVEHLFDATRSPLDLRHLIVATPVARAGSRLLEALVARADAERVAVLPPRIITTGALADLLAPPVFPAPHPTVRALLWGECLRAAPNTVRQAIVPNPPAPDDWPGWLRLGDMLDGLDAELSAGFVSFDEVVDKSRDLESFRGPERWRALARVRALLTDRLRKLELDDPPTRRRDAVEARDVRLLAPIRRVLLVGAADLNAVTRRMLDLIRGQVTALIHAPSKLADRFDRFGCILASEWQSGPVGELDLTVVDGPAQQASCVAEHLARLASDHHLQDVVVGVPDADVVPLLEETLDQLDVPTRNAAGQPMKRTGPVQLMRAVAEHLQAGTFAALAKVARHPDVTARVETDGEPRDWRMLLDRYQGDHVAHRLGERFLGEADTSESLTLRRDALDSVIGELRGPPRPLSRWAQPLASLLIAFYDDHPLDPEQPDDRVILAVCTAIRAILRGLHELPEDVIGFVPGSMALRIVLDAVADEAIPDPPEREAIELLGWLELPFDDTPALVLTGFNEGFVPKAINADPFLPDTLRRHLKLVDNRQRFGRDAFFLSAVLASRKHVALISGRRSGTSDPLGPSRLSLCADEHTVARRVLEFFHGDPGVRPPIVRGRLRAGRKDGAFPIPKPLPLHSPIDSLSVTAFADYLACPYRFYLKHVLKLRSLTDNAVELDGRLFGNLAHEVLKEFGLSPVASSSDATVIRAFVEQRLDEHAEALFGDQAHPAVSVQVEQLRGRLQKFARWQAGWAGGRKRIIHVERPFQGDDVVLDVDGSPFYLHGRIDRIDRDEATGTLYVFDYKAPNKLRSPESDHVSKGQWKNLQLPLYRLMTSTLYPSTPVELGYICLSADSDGVREALAGWSDAELRSAEEVVKLVVRNLRNEVFWPPVQPPPMFSEELAAICQDGRLGGGLVVPETSVPAGDDYQVIVNELGGGET
jgi:ATP-dependent helicase/nuclease subunit B